MAKKPSNEKRLERVKEAMGKAHILSKDTTHKYVPGASRILEEFKNRRAAQKMGLLPADSPTVVEKFELDENTGNVTKLPVRGGKG